MGSREIQQRGLVALAASYLVGAAVIAIVLIEYFDRTRTFGSFWASGHAWLRGLNPYLAHPATWVVDVRGSDIVDINLNPPVMLPLMALIASFPLTHGAASWVALSAALALSCCFHIARLADALDWRLAWALSCSAMIDSLLLAQLYALLLLLGFAIWLGLRNGRVVLAYVALGLLVAFKPNFALTIPVLFLAGHFRLALGAAAIAGFLTLTTLIFAGPEAFAQWLAAVRLDDHWVFPTTVALFSYFARLGLPEIGTAGAIATVLASFAWAYMTSPDGARAVVGGLVASLIASPLSWLHYTLVLVPFVVSAQWNRAMFAGATMLWVPTNIVLLSFRGGPLLQATLGGIYLLGLVLVTTGLLARHDQAPRYDRGEERGRGLP